MNRYEREVRKLLADAGFKVLDRSINGNSHIKLRVRHEATGVERTYLAPRKLDAPTERAKVRMQIKGLLR